MSDRWILASSRRLENTYIRYGANLAEFGFQLGVCLLTSESTKPMRGKAKSCTAARTRKDVADGALALPTTVVFVF